MQRCVWRDKEGSCTSHRWLDWYLCLNHIHKLRVNKVVMAEEQARKMERNPIKPYKPRDGGRREELKETLAAHAG